MTVNTRILTPYFLEVVSMMYVMYAGFIVGMKKLSPTFIAGYGNIHSGSSYGASGGFFILEDVRDVHAQLVGVDVG